MKIIKKLLISLLVIIVILAIAVVVLINLTPRQLHLADIAISGTTIDDLGLADTKIIDIIKSFKNLGNVKEEDVVDNPYNAEEEKTTASTNTSGSSLEGKDNYASIVTEKVTYDKQYLITYEDTTIAYMLNNAVETSEGSSDAVQYLKDAHINIKELTVKKEDAGSTMRVVCLVDLGEFKGQIEEALGGAAKFIKIPNSVYIVSELNITGVNTETGVMTTSSKNICINGNNEDPLSKAIIKIIGKMAGDGESIDAVNNKIGQAIADTIGNLGQIGTAETTEESGKKVVTGAITLGPVGIANNKITVITYKTVA